MFGQPRAPFGGTTSSFGASFGTPSTTTTGFGNTSFGRTTFGNPVRLLIYVLYISFDETKLILCPDALKYLKIHYLRWLNYYIKFACYCNRLFSLLQQQTTSFGTTTTPFGGATSSGTSLFGTQQQPATGGLFGQQQTQQPSTGFSHPSSGFGSTSGGGLFGQTQQPTSTGITIL